MNRIFVITLVGLSFTLIHCGAAVPAKVLTEVVSEKRSALTAGAKANAPTGKSQESTIQVGSTIQEIAAKIWDSPRRVETTLG